MGLEDYIPVSRRNAYIEIAGAKDVGASREILSVVKYRIVEEREGNEERPQINDNDVTKDIRYRLGFVSALNWVLSLPEMAQEVIENLE